MRTAATISDPVRISVGTQEDRQGVVLTGFQDFR